jgi:hypothetical protein
VDSTRCLHRRLKEGTHCTTSMPFCRECGKEVQDDWKLCPYCESSVDPPSEQNSSSQSTNMLLQDSVIAGDVTTTINDPSSISTAVQEASKCPHCDSSGVTIISCSGCDSMAYCSICREEVFEERRSKIGRNSVEYFEEEITKERYCDKCYDQTMSNRDDLEYCADCGELELSCATCWSCKNSYCRHCRDDGVRSDSTSLAVWKNGMVRERDINEIIAWGRDTPPLPDDYEIEPLPKMTLESRMRLATWNNMTLSEYDASRNDPRFKRVQQTSDTEEKYSRIGFCFKEKHGIFLSEAVFIWGCAEDEIEDSSEDTKSQEIGELESKQDRKVETEFRKTLESIFPSRGHMDESTVALRQPRTSDTEEVSTKRPFYKSHRLNEYQHETNQEHVRNVLGWVALAILIIVLIYYS